jgi:hypothetical protein
MNRVAVGLYQSDRLIDQRYCLCEPTGRRQSLGQRDVKLRNQ